MITSYSRDLASHLSALRKVARNLVDEQRTYHREFVNLCQPTPQAYFVGDIVFARQAVCSDATRDQVDKLNFLFIWSVANYR